MIDNTVAIAHVLPGCLFKYIHSIIPAKIGELPIVTTVPTATPVKFTDMKNNGWNNAIAKAAKKVCFQDQFLNEIDFIRIAIINNTPPPINERIIAIVIGWMPSLKYVCVVPTVPHRTAAIKTNMYGNDFDKKITPFVINLKYTNF